MDDGDVAECGPAGGLDARVSKGFALRGGAAMSSSSSSVDRQRFLALTRAVRQLRHEFASSVSGMTLHLEMAGRRIERAGAEETDPLLRNVRMCRSVVARVTAMLDVLGEIAQGADDEPQEFSVGSALRRGAERQAGDAHRRGVRLQVPGSGDDFLLMGVADRLEQAFADMTSYGLARAAHGSVVAWGVEKIGDGNLVGLTFTPASPPGAASPVFSPVEEGASGTPGVSLFLARFIVESHGGTLVAENPAEGTVRLAVRFATARGVP